MKLVINPSSWLIVTGVSGEGVVEVVVAVVVLAGVVVAGVVFLGRVSCNCLAGCLGGGLLC